MHVHVKYGNLTWLLSVLTYIILYILTKYLCLYKYFTYIIWNVILFFFLYFETTHYAQLTVSSLHQSINQSFISCQCYIHEVQWTVQCYDLPIHLNTYYILILMILNILLQLILYQWYKLYYINYINYNVWLFQVWCLNWILFANIDCITCMSMWRMLI